MRHYDKICHNSKQLYAGDGGRCIPCPNLGNDQGKNDTFSGIRISEKVICDGFNHCPNGAGLCYIVYKALAISKSDRVTWFLRVRYRIILVCQF